MKINIINKKTISIEIPLKNDGKYRWKTRNSAYEYGNGFSTANTPYTKEAYVEWQIGYDFEKSKATIDTTILMEKSFTGANKKIKLPYELSEIIYKMLELGIISKEELDGLIRNAEKSNMFLDQEYKIKSKIKGKLNFQGVEFTEEDITLPTFAYQVNAGDPVIEISIQKQQYATGVQPMVYFSIPLLCFHNGNSYIGKTYGDLKEEERTGQFYIDETNKNYFLILFKIFSFCSIRHKHDVNEILKILKEYLEEHSSH